MSIFEECMTHAFIEVSFYPAVIHVTMALLLTLSLQILDTKRKLTSNALLAKENLAPELFGPSRVHWALSATPSAQINA